MRLRFKKVLSVERPFSFSPLRIVWTFQTACAPRLALGDFRPFTSSVPKQLANTPSDLTSTSSKYEGPLLGDKKKQGTAGKLAASTDVGVYCNDGPGTRIHPNGNIFEGTWVNGKLHGQGKLTYVDGRTVEGEWKSGKIYNGTGTWIHPCGDIFEGTWVNGKEQGQGRMAYWDGRRLVGEWKDGKVYSGQGVLILGNGKELKVNWVDGKLVQTKKTLGVRWAVHSRG